jgi:hypothetical protein
MLDVVMLKDVSAGFAYSAYKTIIKMSIRPARDGWFFEERTGTKGGTLKDNTELVKDEDAAIALLNTKIEIALKDGYSRELH